MTDVEHRDQGPPRWPGDTRPPYLPGNRASVGNEGPMAHGAWSRKRVTPIAVEMVQHLAASAPWTASDAFTGARESWAHAEAQAVLLRADIAEHGMFDAKGEERPAVRTLDRVEGRLGKLREALGLTPRALGQLLQTAASVATATGDATSLEALRAEGRKVLAARLTDPPTSTTAEIPAATNDQADDEQGQTR